ncbi:UNVERIFIED_CONTAM: Versican core protein [Trichonephila clavipes]
MSPFYIIYKNFDFIFVIRVPNKSAILKISEDITSKKSCKIDRDCLNGGLCRKLGRGEFFCDCPPLFVGEWCEMSLCEKLHSKCRAIGAICKIAGLNAVCECLPGTIYRRKSGLCEECTKKEQKSNYLQSETFEKDICDPWKCDHGKCKVIGRNYRCE